MPAVVHVWTPEVCNPELNKDKHFWGLGDCLRGTYGLHKLSEQYGFTLIVDMTLHPVGQFLRTPPHAYSSLVQDNSHNILFIYPEKVEQHIRAKLCTDDVILLNTNCSLSVYKSPMSENTRAFLQSILQPNDEFSKYIETIRSQLPYTPYSILHIRLGDQFLIDNKKSSDTLARKIAPEVSSNTIVTTDSASLKEILKISGIGHTLDLKIGHIGYYKTPLENVRDSLVEFFLISGAKHITSLTCYGWISGFIHIISILYNIKLVSKINIKL